MLLQQSDPNAGLMADGYKARAWALLFRSGVTLTTAEGEEWTPSDAHLGAGTANHKSAVEADADGRARYMATNLGPMIEAARTDPVAREACKLLATKLEAQGDHVPEELAASVQGARRHGPNPAKRAIRDANIIRAVWHLKESGLHPYENEAGKTGSACGIVSAVLIELGQPLGYDAVRKIWERHTA